MFTDVRQSNGFSVRQCCSAKLGIGAPEFGAWIGYCEEKGTSQTQRPVSPQRTGYEEGRRIREMRGLI